MNYQNNYYRNQRYDRVDQEDVPESKHTLFIRGLPGTLKTDEIKDFFEDHVGPCSFDFIKLSQDQMKLFVAVRFETRDAAKECMHKYQDGEVLGHPVEMTWFRDIRRYMSYQQNMQGARGGHAMRNMRGGYGRPMPYNRNNYDRPPRLEYRGDDYGRGRKRTISVDRRSESKRSRSSSSRSPTPRRMSRERSRSVDSGRSRGSRAARSRSHSAAHSTPPRQRTASPPAPPNVIADAIYKGSTPPLPPPAPPAPVVKREASPVRSQPSVQVESGSPTPERKPHRSKKDKKKRRRKSPSVSSHSDQGSVDGRSSMELSEGELRRKILNKRERALNEETTQQQTNTNGKPKVDMWEGKTELTGVPRPDSSLLQKTTLKFGLESTEDIPKHVVREPQGKPAMKKPSQPNAPSPFTGPISFNIKGESNEMQIGTPPIKRTSQTPSMEALMTDSSSFSKNTLRDVAVKGAGMVKTEASPLSSRFSTDIDALLGKRSNVPQGVGYDDLTSTAQSSAFASMLGTPKTAQMAARSLLDDGDETAQPSSGLRLSSLTLQLSAESERDRKLARLPPDMLSKFIAKKKTMEMSLKADCETYAFVAKTFIQKDPGLEDRLRWALAESVKDMEEAITRKTDQLLDHLVMFADM